MIAFIEGAIAELTPMVVTINIGGVGYEVNITLSDYSRLQEVESARLYTTEIIREDSYTLYGFLEPQAKLFFEKLRSVSGVGPATARLILSSFSPIELARVIDAGSVELLQSVKGIGLKTAQRIVLDLKGKLVLPDEEVSANGESLSDNTKQVAEEARKALVTLGYSDAAIRKSIKQILAKEGVLTVEELIRSALKQL